MAPGAHWDEGGSSNAAQSGAENHLTILNVRAHLLCKTAQRRGIPATQCLKRNFLHACGPGSHTLTHLSLDQSLPLGHCNLQMICYLVSCYALMPHSTRMSNQMHDGYSSWPCIYSSTFTPHPSLSRHIIKYSQIHFLGQILCWGFSGNHNNKRQPWPQERHRTTNVSMYASRLWYTLCCPALSFTASALLCGSMGARL